MSKRNIGYSEACNRFHSLISKQIRDAKEKHFANWFVEKKGNIKETWKTINVVIRLTIDLRILLA